MTRTYSPSEDLTMFEFKALRHFPINKYIAIQKADKGKNIVILDKTSHISAIEEILIGHTKFSNLDILTGKEIIYITNFEKRIILISSYLKMKKRLIRLLIIILN